MPDERLDDHPPDEKTNFDDEEAAKAKVQAEIKAKLETEEIAKLEAEVKAKLEAEEKEKMAMMEIMTQKIIDATENAFRK